MLHQSCQLAARSNSRHLVQRAGFIRLGATKTVYGSYVNAKNMSTKQGEEPVIYTGPLATVAKRLKLFSVSSLGLSGAISPFVFILDFPVPMFAKTILVGSGRDHYQVNDSLSTLAINSFIFTG